MHKLKKKSKTINFIDSIIHNIEQFLQYPLPQAIKKTHKKLGFSGN